MDTPKHPRWEAPLGAGGGPAPSSHQQRFQHVVAGEGFEPSKLLRWIYSPWAASCDQRKRLTHNNFRAYSPQIADDHRLPPDTSASDSHSRRRATTSSRTLQTAAYPARANTSRDRLSGRAPPRQDRFTRMPQMAHIASLREVTGKRLR